MDLVIYSPFLVVDLFPLYFTFLFYTFICSLVAPFLPSPFGLRPFCPLFAVGLPCCLFAFDYPLHRWCCLQLPAPCLCPFLFYLHLFWFFGSCLFALRSFLPTRVLCAFCLLVYKLPSLFTFTFLLLCSYALPCRFTTATTRLYVTHWQHHAYVAGLRTVHIFVHTRTRLHTHATQHLLPPSIYHPYVVASSRLFFGSLRTLRLPPLFALPRTPFAFTPFYARYLRAHYALLPLHTRVLHTPH